VLNVCRNELTDIKAVTGLRDLAALVLKDNKLTTLPASLNRLTSLTAIGTKIHSNCVFFFFVFQESL
jgi:Leucine-rich repeat (LRR) protein